MSQTRNSVLPSESSCFPFAEKISLKRPRCRSLVVPRRQCTPLGNGSPNPGLCNDDAGCSSADRWSRTWGYLTAGTYFIAVGGCASGNKVQLDTSRLHYSEITLKATFHHTPETVRRAFGLIAAKKIRPTDYITGEAPLSRLQQVLRHMLNRGGDIKTAIIPGH